MLSNPVICHMAEQHVDDGAEVKQTVPNGNCRDGVRLVNKITTASIAEVGLRQKLST